MSDLTHWLGFAKSKLHELVNRWIRAKVALSSAKRLGELASLDEALDADTDAREDVAQHLASTMAVANLLGRRRTIIEAEAASGHKMRRLPLPVTTVGGQQPHRVEAGPMPDYPGTVPMPAEDVAIRVPDELVVRGAFREAVDDLLARNPRLAVGYRAVQRAYSEGHAFALAKSTDEVLTRRVQKLVADAVASGQPRVSAVRAIAELGGWSENYAETVFQTTAASAFSAGRYAQARDPDIAALMPAFELIGRTQVPPSRPNHAAAVGLIAGTNDAIWGSMMPPLGYNCSHVVRLVDRVELRRRGLLREDGTVVRYEPPNFANAHADVGFGRGSVATRFGG